MEPESSAPHPTGLDSSASAWTAEVERSLHDLRLMVDAAGRAAVGSNVLLAHWMARSGGSGASEADLAEALAVAARTSWAAQLEALGVRLEAKEPEQTNESTEVAP